ncbi:MAG TPA: hypothetical protein DCQ31_11450, partial [Bacteroidales bacterium]|nr:hypothetical protein [Bacteroidales bacterium]
MAIPYKSFEQHIDETILERGFQYFKKGYVNEPEEIGDGEFEATVEGTEQYLVQISISNNNITEYNCTCPFDSGPVCKHIVAVIFYLQQNELSVEVKTKHSATKKTSKKKTLSEQVDELLEKVPHEKLKVYIKEKCNNDKSFRQLFLADLAYIVTPDSQALYANKIKALIKIASDRHGYLDYYKTSHVATEVLLLIQQAENHIENSNYQTAVYIALAVLEEMAKAIEYADDSSGEIGGCLDGAMSILIMVANETMDEELRLSLLIYLITAFSKNMLNGFDWQLEFLDTAVILAKNEADAKQIYACLETVKPKDTNWDWNYSRALGIKHKLIEKMDGEAKATQFLEQHLSNS